MSYRPLPPPSEILARLPRTQSQESLVSLARATIRDIITRRDQRLLVIVGPCSLHDRESALEYARWLMGMADRYQDELYIVMRTYFEKPRTTVGWKGLTNDPHLDASHDISYGLELARSLLSDILDIGLPVATEFLDTLSHHYFSDLVSWGAIGARTTESQSHREMASGLGMPIGLKNATNGSLQIALDAMMSASREHTFLSVDMDGHLALRETEGNPDTHIILRGGASGSNYQQDAVMSASALLEASGYQKYLMVDMSHANSAKNHMNQLLVARDIASQLASTDSPIMGVMIESHLVAGAQRYTPGVDRPESLCYGQSITDACIGLEGTEEIFEILAGLMRI